MEFDAAEVLLTIRASFKAVDIELGAKERVASLAHFAPRLQNPIIVLPKRSAAHRLALVLHVAPG